jgi:hypothetical protein
MQNINIKKVAIGFDYNESKETNILNSFYVQAVGQTHYQFPDMFGISNLKFVFETSLTNGYGCDDRFLDGTCAYLEGSMALGNLSLPNICDLDFSCPKEEEEDEEEGCHRGALDQAKINFKLGKFCTKGFKAGAEFGDSENRIQLETGSTEAINGLELELKNNEAGDMSATWFKGTTDCPCSSNYSSMIAIKSDPSNSGITWNGTGASKIINIDPVKNKELITHIKKGTQLFDKNGDPLLGLGVVSAIDASTGKITFSSSEIKVLAGTLVEANTAAGELAVKIDGADIADLKLGKPLYAGANAPNTLALLVTQGMGISTQSGKIEEAKTDLHFASPGIANAVVDGDKIFQSTGAYFETVPAINDASEGFYFLMDDKMENKVENNISGYRLKIKLGRFGSVGYEDIINKDQISGLETKDTTTCVRLGFCGSTDLGDLDQVARGAGDILNKISLDWVNHENKVGSAAKTDQQIIALQYKLSDQMSLMYGQKTHTNDNQSDLYGVNYKMNVADDSTVLLKVRGQSKADDVENNRVQIKVEMPEL